MKRVYIAFKLTDDNGLVVHDHPVFAGDIAYDLNQQADIQMSATHGVREFLGPGEAIAAVNDYMREHDAEDRVSVEPFFMVELIEMAVPVVAKRKAKTQIKSKNK